MAGPVTANDITNYKGDAAFGLADSGGLSSYGEYDFKPAQDQLFNLAYLNMQKNKEVWQQKLKDRDDGMRAIADGQLALNNALPGDREKLMALRDEVKDIYLKHNGDVKSDPKVWLELNDKLAKFKTASVVTQSRLLEHQKQMAEAAKETDPNKKEKMLAHIKEQEAKDMYEPYAPYQQTLDYDNAKVATQIPTLTTDKGYAKDDEFSKVTETKTDLENGAKLYEQLYKFGDKDQFGLNAKTFLSKFFGEDGMMPLPQVQRQVNDVNASLKQIAEKEGYNTKDPSKLPTWLQPMQIAVNGDGKVHSAGMPWEDWYKTQLVAQYRDKKETRALDKTKFEMWEKKQGVKINWKKTNAEAAEKYAQVGKNNADARKANAEARAQEDKNLPDKTGIGEALGTFRMFKDQAVSKNSRVWSPTADMDQQTLIGLGLSDVEPKDRPDKVFYDPNEGVIKMKGRPAIKIADFARNTIRKNLAAKMKVEDGVVDVNKLDYQTEQALTKALKDYDVPDLESINYEYGGHNQQKVKLSDGNIYFKRGSRYYNSKGKDITNQVEE